MRDVEPIREALRTQPFRPFELKMVDGTLFTVEHPDWIKIPPVKRPRELWFIAVHGEGDDEGRCGPTRSGRRGRRPAATRPTPPRRRPAVGRGPRPGGSG
jgi:hypothetical protein